ncbi:hypothetical protein SAMN06295974_3705 [Plantibacter flavus]|uniref:Uncharacterized protein n=1 Tax=Plantibacter flavus TaxID=150123 RepID=A0A3N2BL16_9MICO|nr:hypothetical protein [Plantibacter flavus]ROR75960.1 hypothetical protein EDD42_3911 [Plantibacter flavus]SMG48261.1 hypothetical protein SAMN06295974_3705 [Plantibacter flavus]
MTHARLLKTSMERKVGALLLVLGAAAGLALLVVALVGTFLATPIAESIWATQGAMPPEQLSAAVIAAVQSQSLAVVALIGATIAGAGAALQVLAHDEPGVAGLEFAGKLIVVGAAMFSLLAVCGTIQPEFWK